MKTLCAVQNDLIKLRHLVNFFNGRSTASLSSSWWWCTSRGLVQLGDNWVTDSLQFFLLVFKFFLFCKLVGVEPADSISAFVCNCLFVISTDLILQFLILYS